MLIKTKPLIISIWLLVAFLSLFQLVANTTVKSDMSAFMPKQSDNAVGQLGKVLNEGPAARVWLLALENAPADELAAMSKHFVSLLSETGDYVRVLNGSEGVDVASQQLLSKYRYLLDPRVSREYFTSSSLHDSLQQRLDDLASPLSTFFKEWLPSDPTGAAVHILQSLDSQLNTAVLVNDVWFSADHKRALLLVETKSHGFDLDAQDAIRGRIQQAFKKISNGVAVKLITSGSSNIALQTRDRIKNEAQQLSIWATLFMLIFMAWVYRSPKRVLLTAVPLAGGVLLATAAVSYLFGSIHGITLAFGITVLGVAIDYPIHLLSHAKVNEKTTDTMTRIWPTLRLGVLSTILGYTAMALTDFDGLAQLGVFSVVGLSAAALLTRSLLPVLMLTNDRTSLQFIFLSRLLNSHPGWWLKSAGLVLVLLICSVVYEIDNYWSEDIAELSPIPVELRQQDRELRQQIGAAESRYLLIVEADNLEHVLQRQEILLPILEQAIVADELVATDMVAQILPSRKTQAERQQALPSEVVLRQRLVDAIKDTPFRSDLFLPFINDVSMSRSLPLLSLDNFEKTQLGLRYNSLISVSENEVLGLVRLIGVKQASQLQQRLNDSQIEGLRFIDIKQSSSELVGQFRAETVERISWAVALIVLVLFLGLRDLSRVLRVLIPVTCAVVVAAAVPLISGVSLNLFHLVSLLLVAGIGLDYSLFFSRLGSVAENNETLQALLVCCISTSTVFVMLSTSSIPVLHSIGVTVFSGVLAAFGFSWLFSRNTDNLKELSE